MQDAVFKICIFGDGGVGKTTLVNKYLTGVFKGDTSMTIGLDFHVKIIDFDGLKVKLQIWDFAGEERFRFFLPTYMKGASGGIFMYDITRYTSLKNINDWFEVLKENPAVMKSQVPILLVGGKLDLNYKRSVNANDALQMVIKHNLQGFIECSAPTGENVESVFESLTRLMISKADLFESDVNSNTI